MNKPSQSGFAHLAVVLLVLVVAIIGVAGWLVMQQQDKTSSDSITIQSSKLIQTKQDLDREIDTLNSAALDKDLDPSELDQDLNSLL